MPWLHAQAKLYHNKIMLEKLYINITLSLATERKFSYYQSQLLWIRLIILVLLMRLRNVCHKMVGTAI